VTVHGLIVVRKETGLSSHDVVERIRRIFHTRKVGHFGTLDPAATGVLLIALGHATRFFDFYNCKEKWYSGLIKFGYATTTYDSEGTPLAEKKFVDLRQHDLQSLLADFVGRVRQYPPPFSAKKFKGKPLYAYARKNQEVQRLPSEVEIFKLQGEVLAPDTLGFHAVTSSGTYIRSLAHDIGQRIGSGAYLHELCRDRIGEFGLEQALTLEEIRRLADADQWQQAIRPIETLLPEFSKIIVGPAGSRCVQSGMLLQKADIVKIFPAVSKEYFRVFSESGQFLAIVRKEVVVAAFRPHLVFPAEKQAPAKVKAGSGPGREDG
jgi:tRNA pseudouridine55 synthase